MDDDEPTIVRPSAGAASSRPREIGVGPYAVLRCEGGRIVEIRRFTSKLHAQLALEHVVSRGSDVVPARAGLRLLR